MKNEKAIIIKGLNKEYYKKDSSHKGFFDMLKPNKTGQVFSALKDINLEITRGEIIGIIGPNGAGKSTLLKILAEVTPPTSGSVEIYGKVASILEIGIGFQPELSGYENIFLSGKLYGLSTKQINSKLDKIIEMFGFPDFLQTEVKYYSSGMYMRLAFSIIINIEADIYLFDEILSVGDKEFQAKALKEIEKLKDIDATVLVVTHAPDQSISIYDKILFLVNGNIVECGMPYPVYLKYLNNYFQQPQIENKHFLNQIEIKAKNNFPSENVFLSHFEISNSITCNSFNKLNCNDDIFIKLQITSNKCLDFHILFLLKDSTGFNLGSFSSDMLTINNSNIKEKIFKIKKHTLTPANYIIDFIIFGKNSNVYASYLNLIKVSLSDFNNPEKNSIMGFFNIPLVTEK